MAAMAPRVQTSKPHLQVVEEHDPKEIVAVVLADGSVRDLRCDQVRRSHREWTNGSLFGPDWVLWWQRRRFETAH